MQREHEEGQELRVEVDDISKGDRASTVNCHVLGVSYVTGSVV